MKRGLVIGKFMPVHIGHVALISFAADHCDELIVSMSYTPNDPINHELRLRWLQEIFNKQPKIKIHSIMDDFDREDLPLNERTALWARVLQKVYPSVHLVVSSEPYGSYLAKHLKAESILFDQDRRQFPISASQIRMKPIRYWNFLPKIVQPYFVIKVCFNGPESTGKSSMAKLLADKYKTEFVPEVARELIKSNDFTIDDIIQIGYAQTDRINKKLITANRFLFCDTDLITTRIYSEHYLNKVPAVLYELEKQIKFDLYFLFDIDVPWVSDGLRDLGHKRAEMMEIFKKEIIMKEIKPITVSGSWEERETLICHIMDSYF